MKKSDLAEQVAKHASLSNAKSLEVVNDIFDHITNALSRGEAVTIKLFGTFSIQHRQARQGRNPKTGEPMAINSSINATFKPSLTLKQLINQPSL